MIAPSEEDALFRNTAARSTFSSLSEARSSLQKLAAAGIAATALWFVSASPCLCQSPRSDVQHAPAIKTVALLPLRVPRVFVDSVWIRQIFEGLIVAGLQQAGLTVVPPSETEGVWRHRVDSVGGYYDAYTGRLVEAKYGAVIDGTMYDLRGLFPVDALVFARVAIVEAKMWRGSATWDGTQQRVAGDASGRVPALSLLVAVFDSGGATAFRGRGGIEVMMAHGSLWHAGQVHELDASRMFKDDGRNHKAVVLALDSLPIILAQHAAPR